MKKLWTRRDVCGGAAMVAAGSVLPPGIAQGTRTQPDHAAAAGPARRQTAVRLGVASYSLRNFDQAYVIDAMKQLRTTYVNLKDMHLPTTPLDQVRTRADQYRAAGLTVTGVGTVYFKDDTDADVRSKFDYAKAAGVPLIVGAPTHGTLARVERFAREYDIRVAIHNHGPEDKEWPSPLDVLGAVRNMDPHMGLCIDVGHTMRTGTDVVDAIRKAGPRLFDIHMKDLAESTVKESQVPVGEGLMPVRAIFEQLIAMRYKGLVDLEYEIRANDPMPGMIESFAYMRGVLAGMGYASAQEPSDAAAGAGTGSAVTKQR